MPTSRERVPNKPLTGAEVAKVIIERITRRFADDGTFNEMYAYREVAFDIKVRVHLGEPVGAHDVVTEGVVRDGEVERGAPPLPTENGEVVAFDLHHEVESPNLERVALGLPITIAAHAPSAPGDIFPRIEQHEVKYDPDSYPKPEPPVETDKTAETAEQWKVPVRPRRRAKPKGEPQ